jgi:O-methyltransferase involved in polyketide biosynthesis
LADVLVEGGLAVYEPTFVIWEGVSMYLDREAVHDTLGTLKSLCGRGSVIAMDFWQHIAGPRAYELARTVGERSFRWIGEPLTFELPARDVGALLETFDFEVTDLAESRDATARYATAGRHCDPGMYTIAARRP